MATGKAMIQGTIGPSLTGEARSHAARAPERIIQRIKVAEVRKQIALSLLPGRKGVFGIKYTSRLLRRFGWRSDPVQTFLATGQARVGLG